MYRTSGVMTSRVDSDVTPCVCVELQLLVYVHTNVCKSPIPPSFRKHWPPSTQHTRSSNITRC